MTGDSDVTAVDAPVDGAGRLAEEYARIATLNGWAAEATALRTESLGLREVFAHLAGHGAFTLEEMRDPAREDRLEQLEPVWGARLARVIALQDFTAWDRPFALDILRRVVPVLPGQTQRFHRLYVELLLESGQYSEARQALDAYPHLATVHEGYYETDLTNPFIGTPYADAALWTEGISRQFQAHGLEPVRVEEGAGAPFDRLTSDAPAGCIDGPLVSVMMTTFAPERSTLMASVQSVLRQTWREIELLVVDDASSGDYDSVLEELVDLDERVRVVRLKENSGTYMARNVALREARGQYVTNQDDDDWSHPRRIEIQMAPLLADPTLPGSRAPAVAADDNLKLSRPGYSPIAPHAATLLFRTALARTLGGYLPARKAADNELHQRIEAATGRKITEVDLPLAVYRIRADSLSRGDFRAGWSHPARRAFRAAYAHWHANAEPAGLTIAAGETAPPVPIPERFQLRRRERSALDVVYVCDWRRHGPTERAALDEVRALTKAGQRVGIAHVESPRVMEPHTRRPSRWIQALINDGTVVQVLPDDRIRAGSVILADPSIAQFRLAYQCSWAARAVLVFADSPPGVSLAGHSYYTAAEVSDNVADLFGQRPVWVPHAPGIRRTLCGLVQEGEISTTDVPTIIDAKRWRLPRTGFRSTRPVVGRYGSPDPAAWPDAPQIIKRVYRLDGSVDVRFLGSVEPMLKSLSKPSVPSNWVVFSEGEISSLTFLRSLDFYLSYSSPMAFRGGFRPILESAAAGALPMLPRHLKDVYGNLAVYYSEHDPLRPVRALSRDFRQFRAASESLQERVAEKHGGLRYIEALTEVLRAGPIPEGKTE